MLETKIAENTAALAALAAAVADLTAAFRASAPAPAPVAAPDPIVASGVISRENAAIIRENGPANFNVDTPAPAPASMPLVNPVPVSVPNPNPNPNPAPAPASMPPVNPVPAAAAPVAAPAPADMSGDDLRKLCVKAGAAGLTAEVVTFLSANGCQKLAQLPPEKYGDLVALLKSKGVE